MMVECLSYNLPNASSLSPYTHYSYQIMSEIISLHLQLKSCCMKDKPEVEVVDNQMHPY